MKLYLLNDHKAVATDDRSGLIRIMPHEEGVLTVAGVSVESRCHSLTSVD